VAQSNGTILEFEGLTPGVWLDHVQMRDTGRKYFLPEESMNPLLAKSAYGPWTLQLWDTRLGSVATNSGLLSWRLNLSYVRTNPPLTRITNGMVAKGIVSSNDYVYFVVDVPCDSAVVTNTLTRTFGGGTLDLLFNQDTFPTGTALDDTLLLDDVVSGAAELAVGFYPLRRPGPYYLAVRNTVLTDTNAFTLKVEWGCAASAAASLSIGSVSATEAGLVMTWSAPAGAEFTVLYASDPLGPWSVAAEGASSTTGAFSYTDNGTSTGGLSSRRFYRLVRTR
jgi:hypothetical protein